MTKLVKRSADYPFGVSRVGTRRSSTGIYGKKVGGAKANSRAVRVRRGRR